MGNPGGNGKHARWWTKVYGSGVKNVDIVYRAGRDNLHADALSRQPYLPAPQEGVVQGDLQVCAINSTQSEESSMIGPLLEANPGEVNDPDNNPDNFAKEQRKDGGYQMLMNYLEKGMLPEDKQLINKVIAQAPMFTLVNQILYFVDAKQNNLKRVVVPPHLRQQLMSEYHSSVMSGHFSGVRLYNTLCKCWYWEGMYTDCLNHGKTCPQCAVARGTTRKTIPPLKPIPVSRIFQIVGVDIMELPKTQSGNRYVVVFQDFLSKWPMVFPVADQKASTLVKLLVEEVIPFMGVPEALLSDQGTNLLSTLMLDVCEKLGIQKLNTTAYHPQCNGLVERFNRTLKTMLRKQAATYGTQWDKFLAGTVWAYRNTPHEATGEKPSFLLFGIDCRSPSEAALLPPTQSEEIEEFTDYRQELVVSLSSARAEALKSIREAQKRYKSQYDKKQHQVDLKIGDWVLVYFPKDEVGRNRKLSRPWHGPYRVIEKKDPDVTLCKVYFPQEKNIQVHQMRIQPCPMNFPTGYYWYGSNRVGPGRPPKWVDQLMAADEPTVDLDNNGDDNNEDKVEPEPEALQTELDQPDSNGVDEAMTVNEVPEQRKIMKTRTRTIVPPARYQSGSA